MPAKHITPPTIKGTPELPADGIHFGMSFEDYLAAPAVGSSMALSVLRDPLKAWEESWINPYKEEEQADHNIYGQAFHALILEGRDAFDERYIVEPDKRDFDNLLITVADIKKALEENGLIPTKGAKPMLLQQIARELPSANVWDNILAQVDEDADGRERIKADWWQKFDRARKFVDRDPELQELLAEGYSEVSLFWHCPVTGIPKKARVDRLKLSQAIDLKTFTNTLDKPLVRATGDDQLEPGGAITKAIADRKYPFQTSWYLEGLNTLRYLFARGETDHFNHDFEDVDEATIKARSDFLHYWANPTTEDPFGWTWLFVQKGKAPSVVAVEYEVEDMVREQFDHYVLQASEAIAACFEDFGAEQWAYKHGVLRLDSRKLPPYVLEI